MWNLPYNYVFRQIFFIFHWSWEHLFRFSDKFSSLQWNVRLNIIGNFFVTCTSLSDDEVEENDASQNENYHKYDPVNPVVFSIQVGWAVDHWAKVAKRQLESVDEVSNDPMDIQVLDSQVPVPVSNGLCLDQGQSRVDVRVRVSNAECSDRQREHTYKNSIEKQEDSQVVDYRLKHCHDGWVKSDDPHGLEGPNQRLRNDENHDCLGHEEKGTRDQVEHRHEDTTDDVENVEPVAVVQEIIHWPHSEALDGRIAQWVNDSRQ